MTGGLQDVVRCFACDGGLNNWDPDDDPWIEHARWFPKCPFVRKVKGQEYVDLVRRMTEESDEEEDAMVHSAFQRDNPMTEPPTLEQLNLADHAEEPSQLESDAAQIIIQTGYSRKAVAMAIEDLISKESNTETDDVDTETILRENKSLKSIIACHRCQLRNRNILFLPCTHHCLCQVCAEKCSLCPICYKIVKEKIKTYMI